MRLRQPSVIQHPTPNVNRIEPISPVHRTPGPNPVDANGAKAALDVGEGSDPPAGALWGAAAPWATPIAAAADADGVVGEALLSPTEPVEAPCPDDAVAEFPPDPIDPDPEGEAGTPGTVVRDTGVTLDVVVGAADVVGGALVADVVVGAVPAAQIA